MKGSFAARLPATERPSIRPLDQRPAGQVKYRCWTVWQLVPSTEFAVIEFDHYAGDIFDGIQGSVGYLNEHGVKMAASGPVGVGFIGTGMISDTYLENLTSFPDVYG